MGAKWEPNASKVANLDTAPHGDGAKRPQEFRLRTAELVG